MGICQKARSIDFGEPYNLLRPRNRRRPNLSEAVDPFAFFDQILFEPKDISSTLSESLVLPFHVSSADSFSKPLSPP